MTKKIVIAGGTGFVGTYLAKQFRELNYEVIIISRQEGVQWSDKKGIVNALENAEILINLAGTSVNCRHNEKNKKAILNSRIQTTKALGEALSLCENPPESWMNASGITIFRYAKDKPMTESTGEIGTSFSSEVAIQWEQAFFSFELPKTRQIALRFAVVFGKNGGLIKPYINLVRFGLGGKQGNGNQMFSWIHIEDLFQIILFLATHKEMKGAYNCTSPNPVDNKTLMKTFRKSMGVKIGIPSPAWVLKIGALIIKTEPELILESCWVLPEKLLKANYQFKYPTIESALNNILEK